MVLAVLGRGIVASDTPIAVADDPGLTRGDGCFEGCRLVAGAVDKLNAHLTRMAASAAALDIAFDTTAWRTLIGQAVDAYGPDGPEAAVKLALTRGTPQSGPLGFVTITPMAADSLRQRVDGVTVVTLERGFGAGAFDAAPWLLGGVKTLSYAVNMAAQREAVRRGADDVLFLSAEGLVLESPTSTAVWARGRNLCTTPTGGTGILAGTTVARLFDRAAAAGWSIDPSALVPVAELHEADGVWLISSVRGPVEVVELDGKTRTRHPALHAEIRDLCGF